VLLLLLESTGLPAVLPGAADPPVLLSLATLQQAVEHRVVAGRSDPGSVSAGAGLSGVAWCVWMWQAADQACAPVPTTRPHAEANNEARDRARAACHKVAARVIAQLLSQLPSRWAHQAHRCYHLGLHLATGEEAVAASSPMAEQVEGVNAIAGKWDSVPRRTDASRLSLALESLVLGCVQVPDRAQLVVPGSTACPIVTIELLRYVAEELAQLLPQAELQSAVQEVVTRVWSLGRRVREHGASLRPLFQQLLVTLSAMRPVARCLVACAEFSGTIAGPATVAGSDIRDMPAAGQLFEATTLLGQALAASTLPQRSHMQEGSYGAAFEVPSPVRRDFDDASAITSAALRDRVSTMRATLTATLEAAHTTAHNLWHGGPDTRAALLHWFTGVLRANTTRERAFVDPSQVM